IMHMLFVFFFFFQAEDGIRDWSVTGVQTCALPICHPTVSLPSDVCAFALQSLLSVDPTQTSNPFISPARLENNQFIVRQFEKDRSEERRVGKECRARWARDH